jgi:hypothetical protein
MKRWLLAVRIKAVLLWRAVCGFFTGRKDG